MLDIDREKVPNPPSLAHDVNDYLCFVYVKQQFRGLLAEIR